MTTDKIVYPETDGGRHSVRHSKRDPERVHAATHIESDDLELVASAARGERAAFDALYRRHSMRVHGIARRMTGSGADADDITQQVFEKVWHALPKFRATARLTTWLHRVTVNACIDHLRGAGRRRFSDEPSLDLQDPNSGPAEQFAAAQTVALMERALMRLPEKYRVAVILKDIEGHDYKTMRRITRLPITTLKMRVIRGREQLAGIVERMGGMR